jgi:hypothetical protein
MKLSRPIVSSAAILILAVALTLASLRFVWPADCSKFCREPEQAPCPSGSCRSGEQRAGLPFPVLIDSGAGSSPTSGWGKLGPEDLPNPFTFALDVLFYSLLLWLAGQAVRILRGGEKPPVLRALAPLGLLVLLGLLGGYLSYRSSPIRGTVRATGKPDTEILGTWKGVEASTGQEVVVRFYQSGVISISDPSASFQGQYSWTGDNTVLITFHGGSALCTGAPALLKDLCQYNVVDPAAYPEPTGETVISGPTPYPEPPREPVTFGQIDAEYEVVVEGNTLTLAHPSGVFQTLQRVTAANVR